MRLSTNSIVLTIVAVALTTVFYVYTRIADLPKGRDDVHEILKRVNHIERILQSGDRKLESGDRKLESGDRVLQSGDPPEFNEFWQAAAIMKWDWEKPLEYHCKNRTKAGDYLICHDPPYDFKPPCIVYSFGVFRDWRFEETLGRRGCEAHSFDPSIGLDDHIHEGVVHFHNMGIGAKDTNNYRPEKGYYVKKPQIWKMRTLPSIVKMLRHEQKSIDALKVDVEGFEWALIEQLLDSGIHRRVRQLAIEWHLFQNFPKRESYFHILKTYYRLKEVGFRLFKVRFRAQKYDPNDFQIQADVLYVNTKFNSA